MGRVSQKPLGWKCVESYMGQYAAYVGHGHKIGLMFIAYETSSCGCDCKVGAYPLDTSAGLLVENWNILSSCYRLDPFHVVVGIRGTQKGNL